MLPAIKLLEADTYDITANVKLKENNSSSINLTDPTNWNSEDSVIKLTSKASSDNIDDLKDIYE